MVSYLKQAHQRGRHSIPKRQEPSEHRVHGDGIGDEEQQEGTTQPFADRHEVAGSQYELMGGDDDRQQRWIMCLQNLAWFVEQPISMSLREGCSQDVVGTAIPSQINRTTKAWQPTASGQPGEQHERDNVPSGELSHVSVD